MAQEPLFDSLKSISLTRGESCRIIGVLDVLEPRYRLNGLNFPGALDSVGLVGDGQTRALKNLCVVEASAEQARGRNIIDMSGPASRLFALRRDPQRCAHPHPTKGADMDEYRLAIKKAGLRAAVYRQPRQRKYSRRNANLRAAANRFQPRAKRFAAHQLCLSHPLAAASDASEGDGFLRQQHSGVPADDVHPNEILDGRSCSLIPPSPISPRTIRSSTSFIGATSRNLSFAGVVVTVAPVTIVEKQRNAHLAARLASEVLGAEGVIATKIGGGAVDTDLCPIYERCEEMGVKAALIIMERYPDTGITFVRRT